MKQTCILLFTLFINHCFSQTTFHQGFCIKDNYKDLGIRDMKQTSDGGYIVLQQYADSVSLLKIDNTMAISWTKNYTNQKRLRPEVFEQTTDGGYILTGAIYDNNTQIFLLKTDKDGNSIWVKQFEDPIAKTAVYISSIKQTSDGGFIIGGDAGSGDLTAAITLLKTDNTGTLMWSKR